MVLRTEKWLGVLGKVRGTIVHKGDIPSDMAMEGDGLSFLSPEHVPLFKVGIVCMSLREQGRVK